MPADTEEAVRVAEAVIEAAAKATPGPWQRSGVRVKLGIEDCIAVGPDTFNIAMLPTGSRPEEHAGAFKDAGFIALANPANATLLAQAYLAALKDIAGLRVALERIGEVTAHRKPPIYNEPGRLSLVHDIARAALASHGGVSPDAEAG